MDAAHNSVSHLSPLNFLAKISMNSIDTPSIAMISFIMISIVMINFS